MDDDSIWKASAEAVRRASAAAGGPTALARALGIEPATVSGWTNGDRRSRSARLIPLEQAIRTDAAVKGRVAAEEMRPDKRGEIAYLRAAGTAPTERAA